jgi:hypothetical protein
MVQITVEDLKKLFLDRTLFCDGSELIVKYEKAGKGLFNVHYRLVVGDSDLIVGGWDNITKIDANKNICEDIVHPLISRGHFLLHNAVVNGTPKDTDR